MSEWRQRHAEAAKQLPEGKIVLGATVETQASGGTYEHIDPSTGDVIATVPVAGAREVDAAVHAARAALGGWKSRTPADRAKLLRRLADLLERDRQRLGVIGSLEIGTPLSMVRDGMVPSGVGWIRYYAGWADKLDGQVLQHHVSQDFTYTIPEPVGVVVCSPGWNFTLLSVLWKLSAALIAGNTIIIKTTGFAAFSAIRFVELAQEVGFPAGVINLLSGDSQTGAILMGHSGIDKISFTGGPGTARHVMTEAAGNLTPVLLELGGKSASLVFSDCKLDEAVQKIIGFALSNTGQVCASPSRVLIEDAIYEGFIEKALGFLQHLKIGDPLLEGTYIGPIGYQDHWKRVKAVIEGAKQQGAGRLLAGDEPLPAEGARGYYVAPTLFGDVDPKSDLATQETFGPVLSLFRFSGEEQAVELANGLPYGLSAYAWTSDLARALRLANELKAGAVNINKIQTPSPEVPFGGVGLSGFGKEGGRVGIDEFLNYKSISIAR